MTPSEPLLANVPLTFTQAEFTFVGSNTVN